MSASNLRRQVIALVTEMISSHQEGRITIELMRDLVGDSDPDQMLAVVNELASFAGAAVELWASHTGDSTPLELLQEIALALEEEDEPGV